MFFLQSTGKTWSADFVVDSGLSQAAQKTYLDFHGLEDVPALKELVTRLENAVTCDDPRTSR